jgi:hypothetical protein
MRIAKLILLVGGVVITSCGTLNPTVEPKEEDELLLTRKYVGEYLEYRHTGPETYSGFNVIWIKTSLDTLYGKFSAYGKKCKFISGDRLYLRRDYYVPGGVSGYWVYKIENDSELAYKLTEFQHDREVSIETWF